MIYDYYFDVDGTLIKERWDVSDEFIFPGEATIRYRDPLELDYYGMKRLCWPHKRHIELLKAYKKRGFTVAVWSANGKEWADEVVDKLGIREFVDATGGKPRGFIDDLPLTDWSHLFWLEDK